jgi:hypothetical protein
MMATESQSAEIDILEPWVDQCTINSALNQDTAIKVDNGIVLEKTGKLTWSPQVEGAEGVLVVHPLSPTIPATIHFKFSTVEARGKTFVFKSRGSDFEPGVMVKISANKKILREFQVDKKWQIIKVPEYDLPENTKEIVIEIQAMGWMLEYLYIDFIGFR